MKFKSQEDKLSTPDLGQRHRQWNQEEHDKMFSFLKKHRDNIIKHMKINIDGTRINRRQFFTNMAALIETKDERQCKSRYQKKEMIFLKALDVPEELIKTFKKLRAVGSTSHTQKRKVLLEDCKPISKEKKSKKYLSSESIYTYEDLRTTLSLNFLPRIQNDVIRGQIEKFLEALPNMPTDAEELPSFNLNSISIIQPQFSVSMDAFKERAPSFLNDSAWMNKNFTD